MRLPRLQLSVHRLMALIALAAAALIVVKLQSPSGSPYRMIEVIHRSPNGSVASVETMGFNLDAPVDDFHGMADGRSRYRQTVARLKAGKAEFKISNPRGFHPNGRPIP